MFHLQFCALISHVVVIASVPFTAFLMYPSQLQYHKLRLKRLTSSLAAVFLIVSE